MFLTMLIIGLVGVYETVVVALGIWLNETRYQEGPIVLRLTADHSLHLMDLAVIGAALLPWVFLVPGFALGYVLGRRRAEMNQGPRTHPHL